MLSLPTANGSNGDWVLDEMEKGAGAVGLYRGGASPSSRFTRIRNDPARNQRVARRSREFVAWLRPLSPSDLSEELKKVVWGIYGWGNALPPQGFLTGATYSRRGRHSSWGEVFVA